MYAGTSPLKEIEHKLKLVDVEARLIDEPTRLDENSLTVLKYRTPDFRATAIVDFAPNNNFEDWKVGWIQACTNMTFQCWYGSEGYSSWEFPELVNQEESMISDCDGSYYPWYGSNEEVVQFRCPDLNGKRCTIQMVDNFHPHVTWRNPTNPNRLRPNLTYIIRRQSFLVWLVAWKVATMKSYILKNFHWNMNVEIRVNPDAPVGHRAQLVSSPLLRQPVCLSMPVAIPPRALLPPNANSAQRLVWYPTKGTPVIIIPPAIYWQKKTELDKKRMNS